MSSLLLGIRMSLFDFQRIKMENVDYNKTIQAFKLDVSEKANIPKESIVLVYCGNILDDEVSLKESGLKPGVMVHVLKKKVKEPVKAVPPMSAADIHALVFAFKTFTLNSSYKSALQKLSRADVLENIILTTPGLSQDPVAIAMIQDPELMVRMGDADTVRRIVEEHPALAEAANHIAAMVHEEAAIMGYNNQPSSSSLYSNLMDLFSDEDDMESSQSSDSMPQSGVSRQPSFAGFTAAQVAAALASATRHSGSWTEPSRGESSAASPGESGTTSGITPEQVRQAMERVMESVSSLAPGAAPASASGPAAATPQPNPSQEQGPDLTEQMRQMRELGLDNEALNLQALQISGGNVHAAVDLVFSGAISSNHS